MSDVVIFHNPNCSTSRKVLDMIRAQSVQPKVVDYMKAGWTKAQLEDLLKRMGRRPRDILRTRNTEAEALGLTEDGATDEQILDAMVRDPVLVERPIVSGPKGVALCRPAETVLALL